MHKKHRQHKNVAIASPRLLGIGGVGVTTYPLYSNWGLAGSMGFTTQTTNGEPNGEAPESPAQEAAEGGSESAASAGASTGGAAS